MNVYDTANKLASEIKASNEYLEYKRLKEFINSSAVLKEKVKAFEEARYEAQIEVMQGKQNTEKLGEVQKMYTELLQNQDIKKYFDAELKFNVMLTDVNRIIGESVKDVM